MNRLAHQRTAKWAALLAALTLAMAPVDFLAICGCSTCGCAAAAEDSPGCCCTGKSHTGGSCGQSEHCESAATTAKTCCQPDVVPTSEGCSCSKSVPEQPTGTLPNSRTLESGVAATVVATLPPIVVSDSAASRAASADQPLWLVPARILYCVWRI